MTSAEAAAAPRRAPFRPFFLLAGVDGMAGGLVWLPPWPAGGPGADPGAWHRQELLFGMVPAVLAGFLLTALPRWTGRPGPAAVTLWGMALLWLAGRAASCASPAAPGPLPALFILALAGLAARDIVAARSRRDEAIVALVAAFGLGALLSGAPPDRAWADIGLRLSLAAVLGLVTILGGRIVPALTAAYLESRGESPWLWRLAALECAAAATWAAALAAWILAPEARPTGYACAIAAVAQLARLLQWRGWRVTGGTSVLALHLAYAWISLGLALLAADVLEPAALGRAAAVHAWATGAVGLMSLAVMASMIRKRAGIAFVPSRAMTAAYLCLAAACAARLLPELFRLAPPPWLKLAALAWAAAFGLFLLAFRKTLLAYPRRPRLSTSGWRSATASWYRRRIDPRCNRHN